MFGGRHGEGRLRKPLGQAVTGDIAGKGKEGRTYGCVRGRRRNAKQFGKLSQT